jgi:hypothetical protein
VQRLFFSFYISHTHTHTHMHTPSPLLTLSPTTHPPLNRYGGLVARAAIAALKQAVAAGPGAAEAFSHGAYAAAVGVRIPTLVTINSPQ